MDPDRVKTLITCCQEAYDAEAVQLFDRHVRELAKALDGVVIGEIDWDALVHSFI